VVVGRTITDGIAENILSLGTLLVNDAFAGADPLQAFS
jgi:hypothetical protein